MAAATTQTITRYSMSLTSTTATTGWWRQKTDSPWKINQILNWHVTGMALIIRKWHPFKIRHQTEKDKFLRQVQFCPRQLILLITLQNEPNKKLINNCLKIIKEEYNLCRNNEPRLRARLTMALARPWMRGSLLAWRQTAWSSLCSASSRFSSSSGTRLWPSLSARIWSESSSGASRPFKATSRRAGRPRRARELGLGSERTSATPRRAPSLTSWTQSCQTSSSCSGRKPNSTSCWSVRLIAWMTLLTRNLNVSDRSRPSTFLSRRRLRCARLSKTTSTQTTRT